ncbi:MAG: hypothetical protein GXP37_04175 [Chloroflexi bacterium]|nr:hypothetical protein [Chloroflexota bacterium]
MPLFVLGLDGATWDLLDPLMAAGHLPHLQTVLQAGVRAPLRSTYPPVTALAWPSFYTGVNAGKHGVFSFVHRDHQGKQQVTGASHVQAPAIWELLAGTQLSVGVMGMPITYPASAPTGFALSGFLTPPGASGAFAPPSLAEELQAVVGEWIFHVPPPGHDADLATTQAFVARLMAETEQKRRAIAWLQDRFQPDVFMTVLMNLDTIQHVYWGVLHPQHPRYHLPESEPLRQALLPALRQIDALIGEVAARVLPQGTLLLVSDHGFGPMYRRLALNNALAQHGFLRLRRRRLLQNRLQRRASKLWRRLGAAEDDARRHVQANPALLDLIDWSQTGAFAGAAHELCIHLNRSDRYAHGIVAPQDVPALVDAITEMLLGLRDEQGQALIAEVLRPQELFSGPQVSQAPDLFVRPADVRDVVTDGLLRGRRLYRWETQHAGGWHRPDGILAAAGAGIRAQARLHPQPTLLDMVPTMLQLLGYIPPAALDGRVLAEMLTPPASPPQSLPETTPATGGTSGLTADEQAALEERLRGLDYLT